MSSICAHALSWEVHNKVQVHEVRDLERRMARAAEMAGRSYDIKSLDIETVWRDRNSEVPRVSGAVPSRKTRFRGESMRDTLDRSKVRCSSCARLYPFFEVTLAWFGWACAQCIEGALTDEGVIKGDFDGKSPER